MNRLPNESVNGRAGESTDSRYRDSMAVGFTRARGRSNNGEWQELKPSDPALQSAFGYVTAPELEGARVSFSSTTARLPVGPKGLSARVVREHLSTREIEVAVGGSFP